MEQTSIVTNGTSKKAKGTTVVVKEAKKTDQPSSIEIFDIEKSVISLTLLGTSNLIVNNFNQKSIQQMEDERALDAGQKREMKKQGRAPVIPEERYELARILDEDGRDCIHAYWVKACLVTACKYPDIEIPSTRLRGAVHVLGNLLPIKHDKKKPNMRRDVVRVGKFPNKQPDLRYRPEYQNWSLDVQIEFEPSLISLRGLHHLIRRAGTSVGLCEWRPEKSPAGTFGRFDIKGL